MKKISIIIVFFYSLKLFGQCSPDTLITNNYLPNGTLPIPIEGFLKPTSFYTYPGQPFEKVITAMAPQQTTITNPIGFPPTISVSINWIRLTNLNNLPTWLSYQCGGQLDPTDPCKMAYPTWSCVNAFANTSDGKVPLSEIPGTTYNLEVIVDADVQTIGTQSNYNGGSLTLFILDSMQLNLDYNPCNGGKIEAITSGAFNEPEAIDFLWSTGQTSPSIVPTQIGWYYCNIKDQLTGWEAQDSIFVDVIYPEITLVLNAITQPTNQNDGAISVTATGGAGNLTYAWTGPNTFNSSMSTINNLSGGDYTVTVVDTADCSITQSYHLSAAGIEEIDAENTLLVYPNPSNTNFTIQNNLNEKMEFELTNVEGQIIAYFLMNENSKMEVKTEKFEQGIYFLKGKNNFNQISKKLVVTH